MFKVILGYIGYRILYISKKCSGVIYMYPQYQGYMPHPPTLISYSCLEQQLPYVSASTGDSQGQQSHEDLLHEFQPHKADP